jgi:hypothetical protein
MSGKLEKKNEGDSTMNIFEDPIFYVLLTLTVRPTHTWVCLTLAWVFLTLVGGGV